VLSGTKGGRYVEATAFPNLETLVATRVGLDDRPVLIATLANIWSHAAQDAETFQQMGIVEIQQTKYGPALSVTNSRLVRIWGEMRAGATPKRADFLRASLIFTESPLRQLPSQNRQVFWKPPKGGWTNSRRQPYSKLAFTRC